MANDKREQVMEAARDFYARWMADKDNDGCTWGTAGVLADFAIEYATAEGIPQSDGWVAIETGLPERSKNVASMTPTVWITVMPLDGSLYVVKGFYHEATGWCCGKKLPNGSRVIAWQIIPEPTAPAPYQRQSREGE